MNATANATPFHGNADMLPYWCAVPHPRFQIPRCDNCHSYMWPPRRRCHACGADTIAWVSASGRGKIHTFTVVRQHPDPRFGSKVPYVVAMIELDEGPRVMSNVVDCSVDDVRINMPVTAKLVDTGDGIALPVFIPASEDRN